MFFLVEIHIIFFLFQMLNFVLNNFVIYVRVVMADPWCYIRDKLDIIEVAEFDGGLFLLQVDDLLLVGIFGDVELAHSCRFVLGRVLLDVIDVAATSDFGVYLLQSIC